MTAVLTINEAEKILHRPLLSYDAIEQAAKQLLNRGLQQIMLSGGLASDPLFHQDYWCNNRESFWLAHPRCNDHYRHDTTALISSTIKDCLTNNYAIQDAIVIASMVAHQAIRLGRIDEHWPENQIDLPFLSASPLNKLPQAFKPYPQIGLYPIVDNSDWCEKLLPLGIKTIQLRIKEKTPNLESEIKKSIRLAKQYGATLFINDHWQLALENGAEAIHLGQKDLDTANIAAIHRAGVMLGVSTHCYHEIARAHTIRPSYIACGPIFATSSKIMATQPLGLEQLTRWRRTLQYPLVAIGGINLDRVPAVLASAVDGIAVISALTEANNPIDTLKKFVSAMELSELSAET